MDPKSRFPRGRTRGHTTWIIDPRGVTLVELVVVMAVIGILAAVAAPTVSNALKREQARGFAHEVANVIREARNQAVSRGEALRVWVETDSATNAGWIRVWRTGKQLPSGGWGGGACDSETENISTFDCPDGSVCMEDVCEPSPARSCRELVWSNDVGTTFDDNNVRYTMVRDEVFSTGTGLGIRRAQDGVARSGFCISPRGTIEKLGGGFVTPDDAGPTGLSCPNEGFNIWLGDLDESTATVEDRLKCNRTAAEHEEVRGHVVRVQPNGEIGLRPPAKP